MDAVSLPSATEMFSLVTALAPGLVILGIRQWFVAAPSAKLEERLLSYAIVSIVYYALAHAAEPLAARVFPPWAVHALEFIAVPVSVGLLWGIVTQKDVSDKFWNLFNIQLVHHAPTAWDYAFTRLKAAPYVLATLSDGSTVAGRYKEGSFASSSSQERDLLICEVYNSVQSPWTPVRPPRSILLCGRDIRFVEFFQEPNNGKRETAS